MAAKKKTEEEVVNVVEETPKQVIDPNEDRVEITVAAPNEDAEGSAFNICVNGSWFRINYDEPVVVPRYVAHALDNKRRNVAYKKAHERSIKKKLAKS